MKCDKCGKETMKGASYSGAWWCVKCLNEEWHSYQGFVDNIEEEIAMVTNHALSIGEVPHVTELLRDLSDDVQVLKHLDDVFSSDKGLADIDIRNIIKNRPTEFSKTSISGMTSREALSPVEEDDG